jgi:hypothetical protein
MQKFGEEYKEYKQKVPGMNIFLGFIRYNKHRKEKDQL